MSIYGIPRTPTPEVAHQPRNNGKDHSRMQRASNSTCIIPSKQKTDTFSVTEAKNPTRIVRKHANTRKRHLPVNQLTLLRTTTTDGLPHPNDFDVTFSSLIMATDPIADSQTNNLFAGSSGSLISSRAVGLENRLAPEKTQRLVADSSPSRKLLDNASVTDETLRGTSGPTLKSVPDVHITFEGPTRLESQGTSRRSDRIGNYASARNKPTVVRKLTLASGLLPLPADADHDAFHGMRRDDKQSLSEPRTLHKRRHRLAGVKAPHIQLAFVNSRGMC